MTRPRIIAATLLAAGALALAGTALADVVKQEHRHEATIANADGDTALVKVERGPRLHIVTRETDRDEPDVVDIDLSEIGRVVAEAMQEVSRSLENVHVSTVGSEGDERIVVEANGKRTEIDLAQIMRDVDRELHGALRELDHQGARARLHHRQAVIADRRARMEEERAELQAQMDELKDEMAQLREDLRKMKGSERRR